VARALKTHSRTVLTATAKAVLIEHRSPKSVTRTIAMENLRSVDVVEVFLKTKLRFMLLDGASVGIVLGRRSDHQAIADWFATRLGERGEVGATVKDIPLALRNLRKATVKLRKS
jgi:hypothetical protein